MMTPSRSRKKMARAPAWCRKVTDPSADLLCALADWRRRAFRVGLGRYISRATLPHPALAAGKTENRRSLGKRPRPSVRSSDTTGPSSVPCRARVGRCVPGPAHCVVASRRALGPHLVKSRMPKNSARATCQENHLFPPPIKTLGQRENVVPAGSSWFPRKFPRKVDLDPRNVV